MKVTNATKVCSALKADRPFRAGYTLNELVEKLSRLYDIPSSKSFRQEVALALRRGVDYGILVKSKNKYRFDPEKSLSNSLKCPPKRRGRLSKTSVRVGKSTAKKSARVAGSTARVARNNMDNAKAHASKSDPPSVPRPTVPPPPTFTPKPRNLVTEPFNKVIKHRSLKK